MVVGSECIELKRRIKLTVTVASGLGQKILSQKPTRIHMPETTEEANAREPRHTCTHNKIEQMLMDRSVAEWRQ